MIVQRGEFANYLRKNSGVKGDATSSEIQGACSAKLEQCERRSNASWRRHSRITSSTKHRRGPACHQTNVYCSFGPEKSRFGKELSGEHRLWQESDTRMDQPRRCFLSGRVLLGLPVRLTISDAAVTAIYSEHFFEHLDAETEARAFLLECLRCLQSQGVIRLVVPDAWAYSGRRQCHRWLPSSVPGAKKKCEIRFQLSCEETSEIWNFSNVD